MRISLRIKEMSSNKSLELEAEWSYGEGKRVSPFCEQEERKVVRNARKNKIRKEV